MKFKLLLMLMFSIILGCASTDQHLKKITAIAPEIKQVLYSVLDASLSSRPLWISDPELWSKNNGAKIKKYRYFSYETTPKISRNISCTFAKTNVKSSIAKKIAVFFQKQLSPLFTGPKRNGELLELKEFVENTLSLKIEEQTISAAIVKRYWEKRNYKIEFGSKTDFIAYTCAIFIRVQTKMLTSVVDSAVRIVMSKVDTPELKSTVHKILLETSALFTNAKNVQP